MKKSHLIGALCAIVFAVISMSSHASLLGRLPATPGGTDYQAYYDDVADLTWLADANYPRPTPDPFGDYNSWMGWAYANGWPNNLNVSGVTGWRLPTTLQPDSSCGTQSSGISSGYNCTGSEMGNLFYNVLGGVAGSSITITHNSNYDLFSNIQSSIYWSSTLSRTGIVEQALAFRFSNGRQDSRDTWDGAYAWPVQSGDVGTAVVPVPAAVWLFGSGLLGLIGMARRRS